MDVTACKARDLDGVAGGDTVPVAGWPVSLTKAGETVDNRETGPDGCYTWTGLTPGVDYDVHESMLAGWFSLGPVDWAFGKSMSGNSFSHTFVNAVLEGCTPGYWKTHSRYGPAPVDSWPPTGHDPDDVVSSVFSSAGNAPYTALGKATLLEALNFQGGDSLPDKAEILLRAAVAAVLNAAHPEVSFPYTENLIITMVNAELTSQDPSSILALASELDNANNAYGREEPPVRCPLGAPIP